MRYDIKPTGFLWLGGSKTTDSYRNLFEAKDVGQKIYAKKPGTGAAIHFPSRPGAARPAFTPGAGHDHGSEAALQKEADRLLLTKFAPPGVLISADLEIVHFRGDTRGLRGVRPRSDPKVRPGLTPMSDPKVHARAIRTTS
jgi:two-component system CheB/CheR fusion protein